MKTIYSLIFMALSSSSAFAATLDNVLSPFNCEYRGLAQGGVIPINTLGNPESFLEGNTLRIALEPLLQGRAVLTTGVIDDFEGFLRCGEKGDIFQQTLHFPSNMRLKSIRFDNDVNNLGDDVNGELPRSSFTVKGMIINNGRGDVFEKEKVFVGPLNLRDDASDVPFVESTSVCGKDLTVRLNSLKIRAWRVRKPNPAPTAYVEPKNLLLEFADAAGPGCVQGEPVTTSLSAAPGPGVFELRAVHSNKCLDVRDHATWNGARLQQWACTGEPHQKFTLTDVGNGWFNLASLTSGRCVSAEAVKMENGVPMILWDCNGGPDQKVRFEPSPNGGGAYTVRYSHSGKCMDVQDFSSDNGKEVHQWNCSSGKDQDWILVPN